MPAKGHGLEFESHQVRRFFFGSGHSFNNAVNLTYNFNNEKVLMNLSLQLIGKKNLLL